MNLLFQCFRQGSFLAYGSLHSQRIELQEIRNFEQCDTALLRPDSLLHSQLQTPRQHLIRTRFTYPANERKLILPSEANTTSQLQRHRIVLEGMLLDMS